MISIFAVISIKTIELTNGKEYISKETEQVPFTGEWLLEDAFKHAKQRYPNALYFTIREINDSNRNRTCERD